MVSNEAYIQMVNNAVRKGEFNRGIKVFYTKTKPIADGQQGIASHINLKNYDRIAIWKGLARNEEERKAREHKLGYKVIDRDRALRHELWHVHKPYASEKKVRNILEKKPLPRELPTRRRY
jgi:hypothetical protein